MLLQDYNGSVCEVADLNNRLIAAGTMKVYSEYVEVYDEGGHLPIVNLGTQVKLSLRHGKSGMRVMAGKVYVSNRKFLRLVELQNYADYEKRRFFRLTIDHSAFLLLPQEEEAETEVGEEESATECWQELPIRIQDISLCGMQFESGRAFAVGDRMGVSMALLNNELVDFEIEIRRIISEDKEIFRYGCEIVELPLHIEQKLCAFIFSEQQKQIRRSRG